MSEYLHYPTDLKGILWCIAILIAIPLYLWILPKYNRRFAQEIPVEQRFMAIHNVSPRIRRRLGPILLAILFIPVTAIIMMPCSLLTAHVVSVDHNLNAETRQVFIWNKDYGTLPGNGDYIINQGTDTLACWTWQAGIKNGVMVYLPADILTIPPGAITATSSIPDTYIPAMDENSIPLLTENTRTLAPLSILNDLSTLSLVANPY